MAQSAKTISWNNLVNRSSKSVQQQPTPVSQESIEQHEIWLKDLDKPHRNDGEIRGRRAKFTQSDELAGINLSEKNLSKAYLDGANLSETLLIGANLTGALLEGAESPLRDTQ